MRNLIKEIYQALCVEESIYEMIRSMAKVDITESELLSEVEKQLSRQGYEKEQYLFDFLSGERSSGIGGSATKRMLKKGDILLVDFSLCHEGKWCDTCRTFFLGNPVGEQKEIYELLLSAMQAGYEAIRPGVSAEDVYEAVMEPIRQQGLAGRMPHHVGHGIGEEPFQEPVFKPGSKTCLKAGNIVTLEPGLYFPNQWGIRIENNYVVTEAGVQLIFTYPLDIGYFVLS